jgi:hypothetical protein
MPKEAEHLQEIGPEIRLLQAFGICDDIARHDLQHGTSAIFLALDELGKVMEIIVNVGNASRSSERAGQILLEVHTVEAEASNKDARGS